MVRAAAPPPRRPRSPSSPVSPRLCSLPAGRARAPGPAHARHLGGGRTKIWDLAFPTGGLPPLYTENDSGVIFARMNGSEPARPPRRR